jgi:hypothetical protein
MDPTGAREAAVRQEFGFAFPPRRVSVFVTLRRCTRPQGPFVPQETLRRLKGVLLSHG